jgi:hypothetical protein
MIRALRAAWIALATAVCVFVPATAPGSGRGPQVGALDTDCGRDGTSNGGYQFVGTCAGRAVSPDRRFAVVQRAYQDKQPPIVLQDARGRTLAELPSLSDDMPFVLFWAPGSRWFFVNHYQGSGLDRLRLFEMTGHRAVERPALMAAVARTMIARYPCLARPGNVDASGWRWSKDGRRIALVAYARPDACLVGAGPNRTRSAGRWQSTWMIADAATSRIDPASIRVRKDGVGPLPRQGPYATF